MSHRLHRGTLVSFIAGVCAVLMVAFAVSSAATGTIGASGAAGASGVREQEWWLTTLSVPQAWQGATGTGVTVAVLSTGVAPDSPDLAGAVTTGPDYTGSGRTAGGPYWGVCGTAVASIIAGHGHGAGDNSGVIGIAPAAKVLSVRVNLEYNDPLNANAAITRQLPGAIAAGIMYAVSHGAQVIDLPLDPGAFGLSGDATAAGGSPAELSAVRYALARNVVLVAPGGDDGAGAGQANYPAAYPGVIAVGAVNRGGQVAGFSSRRSYVSLTAPGVNLMAASMVPAAPGTGGYAPGYSLISTTSVASGMVAGTAALMLSKFPHLTPAQVMRALRESASGGASIVNASSAMKAAVALAGTVRTAAGAPPVKPRRTVHPASVKHKVIPPRAASAVAGSVLHDAVYGLAALIVLALVVLFVTQARRRRGAARNRGFPAAGAIAAAEVAAGRGRPRGVHEQRRQGRNRNQPDDEEVLAGLRELARPGSATASGWPAPSGWQGGGLGEVAHSSITPGRPALAPPPKLPASRTDRGPAAPPWAPASEPDGAGAPLSLMGTSSFPTDMGTGIRLPGDTPPPFAGPGQPAWFASPDLPAPFADPAMPAPFGIPDPATSFADPAMPAPFGGPDLPTPLAGPDVPAPFGGASQQTSFGSPDPGAGFGGGSDLSGPFAGRDVLTQASFGFAAAPVPADYPGVAGPPAPPEVAHWDSGESTEVFPVVPGFHEEPDTAEPEDGPS